MTTIKNDISIAETCGAQPDKWVYNYADYLYNFAFCRLNDNELSRDLVQETFLSALEKVSSFEGRSSEKTWLTSILKYKIIDIYRSRSSALNNKNNKQNSGDCSADKEFFQRHDGHWNVDDRPKEFGIEDTSAIENKEFHRILKQCIKKLPQLWHHAFVMKFMDDEQTEHICTELKITAANYWVITHRAKLNLRACLQKNWC